MAYSLGFMGLLFHSPLSNAKGESHPSQNTESDPEPIFSGLIHFPLDSRMLCYCRNLCVPVFLVKECVLIRICGIFSG